MSDQSFIRAFEQGRIAPADFHHAALPLAYYSRGRLFSGDARERWVEPDAQAL
jgi:hypothetical protein